MSTGESGRDGGVTNERVTASDRNVATFVIALNASELSDIWGYTLRAASALDLP